MWNSEARNEIVSKGRLTHITLHKYAHLANLANPKIARTPKEQIEDNTSDSWPIATNGISYWEVELLAFPRKVQIRFRLASIKRIILTTAKLPPNRPVFEPYVQTRRQFKVLIIRQQIAYEHRR